MSTQKWSSYMSELYASRKPPILGTVDVKKVEEKAREKMKDSLGACAQLGFWSHGLWY